MKVRVIDDTNICSWLKHVVHEISQRENMK